MKNCIYLINGKKFTYSELVQKFYDTESKDNASDFLYSLEETKQEKLKTKLLDLKKAYEPRVKADKNELGNGELSFDGGVSTQEFIDSKYFINLEGKPLITPLNRQAFIDHIIAENKDSMGEAQAKNFAEQTVQHWDKIAEDSTLLHELITKGFEGPSEARTTLKGTAFEQVYDQIYNLTEGDTNIYNKPKGVLSGLGPGNKLIKNLNMKCKLLGLDEDIIGHIDNIIIDKAGDLHLVNYKISTSGISDVKREKYKYQLALLKQMLAAEGFNVEHISLSIIPIRLKYNEDFTKVTEVVPMDKIEYTIRNGQYVFTKYDTVAQRWIASRATINTISSDKIDRANKGIKALWPDRGITTHGIRQSAKEWIQFNYRTAIGAVNNKPGVYWSVVFSDDDKVEITDPDSPTKNAQILAEVEKRIESLQFGDRYVGSHAILRKVKAGYERGGAINFSDEKEFGRCGRFFDKIFQPYMHRLDRGSEKDVYDWEPIENDLLQNENILMFRNKITKQIDVITISPYDLTTVAKFRGGYTNILGQYIGDNEALRRGNILKGDYGNIEAIRTMFLINEVLSEIDGDYNLGTLQVVSPVNTQHCKLYTFENIAKHFSGILSVVNAENSDINIKNNFAGKTYQDPIDTFMQLLDDALNIGTFTSSDKTSLYDWGIKAYEEADSIEAKTLALKRLMQSMQDQWGFKGSPNEVESTSTYGVKEATRVKLYKAVAQAYLKAKGILDDLDYNEIDMTSMEANMYSASDVPSANANIVTGLFHRAADRIAEESYKDSVPVQTYLQEYYNAIGRSNFQNSTLGLQTKAFQNLYEEIDGKKTMRFKNPYTDVTLTEPERKLLKQALFTFAKVRTKMFPGLKFDFSSYDDPNLQSFVNDSANSWYLEVPLTKANLASRRATGYNFKEWRERVKNVINGRAIENFQSWMENINSEEERLQREDDLSRLSVTNHFSIFESKGSNPGARASILNRHESDFFETNLETLLMNFIETQHEVEQMQDVLLQSKAVLLALNTVGDVGNPRLKKTMEYITKYLTVNVFNKSIMEKDTQKIIGAIQPGKHLATTVYILGNFSSMVRDTTEGLLQNMMRSIIKFQTDINGKDLSKAYGIVVKDSFTNVRSINLLNKLNIKYRISNVDVARIQEVLATGRAGIDNWENWAYATMRRPDYLNRMTLFVAKMIHDGVWDAMDIDEYGEILYDWKKDRRFAIYASGDKSNPEYLKQKGAYFSAILEYNREHPESAIDPRNPEANLPSPYTNAQVEAIKAVSNSIYGAYDKSTKAMYEHMAMGQALGQFTTWMNGMVGNYFRKPGTHTGEMMEVQSTTMAGELEFMDENLNILVQKTREDGSVYYFNETTGQEYTGEVMPLMKHIPITTQGIIYSLLSLAKKVVPAGYKQGGMKGIWEEIQKEILTNPQEMKNFKKLFSDMFMWLFMAMLYKFVIDPAYQEHKKKRKAENLLANSLEDISYRGTGSSYDGFRGPYNVLDSFGNNMNPPAYKVTTKMMSDVTRFTFGDKTLGQLVTQNVPVFRSLRTAYDQYAK